VFTTQGYLNRVSRYGDIYTTTTKSWTDYNSNVLISSYRGAADTGIIFAGGDNIPTSDWLGNIDCETHTPDDITYEDCLDKGDYVFFFSTEGTTQNYRSNPKYHNLYQVEKIYRSVEDAKNKIVLDKHVNFQFKLSDSAAASAFASDARLRAYKFYPKAAVTYVEQCSGRGICNNDEGLCECFAGYTNDDCSVQNSAAA